MKRFIFVLTAIVFLSTLVLAEKNPFGFSDDQLAHIARLEPFNQQTPVLNSLVNKAIGNNWCCQDGLPAESYTCHYFVCCAGYMAVAQQCISIEDLVPVFLRFLGELITMGVIEICSGTAQPIWKPSTFAPITQTTPTTTTRTTTIPTTTTHTTTLPTTTTRSTTSTTTRTTTRPTTTTSSVSVRVYSCNLDSDNCGGMFYLDHMTGLYTVSQSESINNTTVTDVTSITKPTGSSSIGPFNKPACLIPWQQGSKLNYFCSSAFECLVGQPGDYSIGHCQKGRFLWGRTNDHYKTQFNLNSIQLSSSGLFSVNFWAIMWCDGSNCAAAGDSIKVIVDDHKTQAFEYQVSYGNIGQQKVWKHFETMFYTEQNSIDITVQFERKNISNDPVSFAFDELSIWKLP